MNARQYRLFAVLVGWNENANLLNPDYWGLLHSAVYYLQIQPYTWQGSCKAGKQKHEVITYRTYVL